MPSTRRVVSRNSDVWRRLDARRPVVGVVVAEARPQRGAGHEEGHDQSDGELHGVVRQASAKCKYRLTLRDFTPGACLLVSYRTLARGAQRYPLVLAP